MNNVKPENNNIQNQTNSKTKFKIFGRDFELKLTFTNILIIGIIVIVILGTIVTILYRSPENDTPLTTQDKLADILPRGSSGSILKVEGSTYLVVNNITIEEFELLNSEENINKIKNTLNIEKVEIVPSGATLREWAGTDKPPGVQGPGDYEENDI